MTNPALSMRNGVPQIGQEALAKHVHIVGGAHGWEKCPFDGEVWVLGNQADRFQGKKITRIFEIHDDLSSHGEKYPQWLADQNIPLVTGERFPVRGDHIETFPFDNANGLMGQHLTSTPSYMMAMAVLEGYKRIDIWGIDMAVDDTEYFRQRPAMYGWIGYARGRGIQVKVHSTIFTDNLVYGKYGNKDMEPFTSQQFSEMAALHAEQVSIGAKERAVLDAKINSHDGARQAYERLARVARAVESGVSVPPLSGSAVLKQEKP